MSLTNNERRIAALEKQMAEAVGREDYEAAAKLRDEIVAMKDGGVRKPPPGEMGLGTQVPVVAPPSGWVRPKKPDLNTNTRPRRRS